MSSVIIAGDTSGSVTLAAPSVAGTPTLTLPTTSGTIVTSANISSYVTVPPTMKNRIINGGMVIDQRNAGASTTPTADSTYNLDRWLSRLSVSSKFSVQQNAGSVTPPAGFTNYLGITSLSSYTVGASEYFEQQYRIEGYNVGDLNWGTANAKTITLSFWVRSSLTGSFGASLTNNDATRWYPFTYTISSANTWTQISVTINGDTSGTWTTNNTTGLQVNFGLGVGSTYSGGGNAWTSSVYIVPSSSVSVVGTNGATWYITGVQLEVGSSATSFEWRPYTTELQLCQRYYQTESGQARFCYMRTATDNWRHIHVDFKVTMRATPTWSATLTAGAASSDYQTAMSADAYRYYANTTTADYVTTWTASAEL